MKSRESLISFVAYCVAHPEQRFWQALRNWSGYDKIIAASVSMSPVYTEHQWDTFYWEGKADKKA